MLPTHGSKVYVDSNVWGTHFFGTAHAHAPFCKAFLAAVSGGQLKAVVSTFVLQELFAVAVRARAQALERALTTQEMADLSDELRKRVEGFGTEIHDADALVLGGSAALGAFARSEAVLRGSSASFDDVASGKVKWKSPSGADGLHVALAEKIDDVSFVATCDAGMRLLGSNLKVVYVPGDYV